TYTTRVNNSNNNKKQQKQQVTGKMVIWIVCLSLAILLNIGRVHAQVEECTDLLEASTCFEFLNRGHCQEHGVDSCRKTCQFCTPQDGIQEKIKHLQDELKEMKENLPRLGCGCPKGSFRTSIQDACFTIYLDYARTWEDARQYCEGKGLDFAKPNDPIALRNYLNTHYGFYDGHWIYAWISALGTGSYFRWMPNGGHITSESSLWWGDQPGNRTSSSECMFITAVDKERKNSPQQPYGRQACSRTDSFYALCQQPSE
ncbi:unnamed protein product, partial [Meganyctiphanes norvegica]